MVVMLPFTFSVIPFYVTKDGHSVRMAQPKGHPPPQPESIETEVDEIKVKSKGGLLEDALDGQSHQDNAPASVPPSLD